MVGTQRSASPRRRPTINYARAVVSVVAVRQKRKQQQRPRVQRYRLADGRRHGCHLATPPFPRNAAGARTGGRTSWPKPPPREPDSEGRPHNAHLRATAPVVVVHSRRALEPCEDEGASRTAVTWLNSLFTDDITRRPPPRLFPPRGACDICFFKGMYRLFKEESIGSPNGFISPVGTRLSSPWSREAHGDVAPSSTKVRVRLPANGGHISTAAIDKNEPVMRTPSGLNYPTTASYNVIIILERKAA
ncbi:hypothetical protein MRX96_019839 [Rhipicephalus microplus]